MDISGDLKLIGMAIPVAVMALKWLRNHNDLTLKPPASPVSDQDIELLVRRGRTVDAVKAIRAKYACSLQQARLHADRIKARQKGS